MRPSYRVASQYANEVPRIPPPTIVTSQGSMVQTRGRTRSLLLLRTHRARGFGLRHFLPRPESVDPPRQDEDDREQDVDPEAQAGVEEREQDCRRGKAGSQEDPTLAGPDDPLVHVRVHEMAEAEDPGHDADIRGASLERRAVEHRVTRSPGRSPTFFTLAHDYPARQRLGESSCSERQVRPRTSGCTQPPRPLRT